MRRFLLLGTAITPWLAFAAQARNTPQQTPTTQHPAADADPTAEMSEEDVGPDITVTGAREPGAVPGDIKPELQLNAADIRSYGVSSVSDLLTELGPQLRSDRGRGGGPVVLLNGRRISGFGEIRDLPTEAIIRVDILPEEAALRLGYRADQRVVNFVLRPRFRAYTGELQGGGATDGDRYDAKVDANWLRIQRDRRLSVNLHYDGATPILESDRDITPNRPQVLPVGSGNDQAYRTLTAATRTYSTNATYSRNIFGNVAASLNVSLASTASDSQLGLPTLNLAVPGTNPFAALGQPTTVQRYLIEAGPRGREVDGFTGHVGGTLGGDIGQWRYSITGNFDRNLSRTLTDNSVDLTALTGRVAAGDPTLDPFGRFTAAQLGAYRRDYARSITTTAGAELTASGPLLTLPSGKLVGSFKSGIETNSFDARSTRLGVTSASDLNRRDGSVQASIDLPIASKRNGFLSELGNLSLNGNLAYDNYSDFGSLRTVGYGLNWQPIEPVRLIASVTEEEGAPSTAQIGNPTILTPDTRVFDLVTGQTVLVTSITGGNPALKADNRRVMKLGVNLKPFTDHDLTLSADYLKTRTLDPIASFPSPSASIEAAFPGRFTRVNGTLTRVDTRPINFERSDSEELRWGVNFSTRLGPKPPARPAGGFRRFREQQQQQGAQPQPGETPPASGTAPADGAQPRRERGQGGFGGQRGGFGGGGFGGGRGGFGGAGRLNFSVYHTWHFQETIQIGPGLPTLDLLRGDAIGSSGGQPRHELEFQGGATFKGFGARISGNWESATNVRGGAVAAPTNLNFGSLTTVNLRLFTSFSPQFKWVRDHRWLIGTRVTLSVSNLFNQRRDVTDATGTTPLNYQPFLLDPTGRTIRLSIRKLFF